MIDPPESTSRELAEIRIALRQIHDRIDAGTPRFLSVTGAAAYTGLSEKSIRRLLAAGKLQALRPVEGRIVVDRIELNGYVLGTVQRRRKKGGCPAKATKK